MTGVREYEITLDGGEPETRDADEDGVAYYSFRASDVNGHRVTVRSHSENGFVSTAANWSAYFDPWPGVRSDVYFYPEDGSAVGGCRRRGDLHVLAAAGPDRHGVLPVQLRRR
nr:hypothetical protein GCM10020092_106410 [Actinoplanes digitatis]